MTGHFVDSAAKSETIWWVVGEINKLPSVGYLLEDFLVYLF